MIPSGWRVDHVHKCGAMRLVRDSDGALQSWFPEGPNTFEEVRAKNFEAGMKAIRDAIDGCAWPWASFPP